MKIFILCCIVLSMPSNTIETEIAEKATGLKNYGMTCYVNAVLQVLYHLPHFRHVSIIGLKLIVVPTDFFYANSTSRM